MQNSLPLFDPEPELTPGSGFNRDELKSRLDALAAQRIFIGGSSWKYEGWLGQIYSPANYQVRGRFSKKQFEQTCLQEYAQFFPTVCGDFAFYQFPSAEYWAKSPQTAGNVRAYSARQVSSNFFFENLPRVW